MTNTKLYRVILPVHDIEQAQSFYSHVLGNSGERVSPGRHYFNCGGTILACYDPVADGDEPGEGWHHHPFQYLYFAVPNLDQVFALLQQAGGIPEGDVELMPWGERLFYARDLFGNPISFVDEHTVFTGLEKA